MMIARRSSRSPRAAAAALGSNIKPTEQIRTDHLPRKVHHRFEIAHRHRLRTRRPQPKTDALLSLAGGPNSSTSPRPLRAAARLSPQLVHHARQLCHCRRAPSLPSPKSATPQLPKSTISAITRAPAPWLGSAFARSTQRAAGEDHPFNAASMRLTAQSIQQEARHSLNNRLSNFWRRKVSL